MWTFDKAGHQMMHDAPVLLWLRRDLRLEDNPALHAAANLRTPLYPVFIWAPEEEGAWSPGGAHRWWMHHALVAYTQSLQKLGLEAILRRGPSLATLKDLIRETGAGAVYWNTRYEPDGRKIDDRVAQALKEEGIRVKTFESHLLHNPETIRTGAGHPYQVFTPFWRKIKETLHIDAPLPAPAISASQIPDRLPTSLRIEDFDLLPKIDWAAGLRESWTPGEQHARHRLQQFVDARLSAYPTRRDRPDEDGTSMLSPHLHTGEVSPRTVWHAVASAGSDENAAEVYLREIGWREFSYHLLYHFPKTPTENLKEKFDDFPWNEDPEALKRWQKGQTGYPIVDAGMRQLWHTGWMHNRVRMIVASFLTKHLLQPWQHGARWFWDTLVDGNLANNTMGWQWSAGSGADAQPFFRIFNPVTQGERYDPHGAYVRTWVPELRNLPDKHIHSPWTMPADVRRRIGFEADESYPAPIIDHKQARARALEAFEKIR